MTLYKILTIVSLLFFSLCHATPYISGGTNVLDGDIPYQAFLQLGLEGKSNGQGEVKICTGTLIKPDVILTSASCGAK